MNQRTRSAGRRDLDSGLIGSACCPATKLAIWLTALTASRQIEVMRATWDQFDLESAVWVKPECVGARAGGRRAQAGHLAEGGRSASGEPDRLTGEPA